MVLLREKFVGIECLLGLSNSVILPSALFPPISYFALILRENQLGRTPLIEYHDHFVKQTVRNRYRIYTSQGEHLLSVPLVSKSSKSLIGDISINYNMPWQKEHLRTLNAAYSSTPFYEHYISILKPIFESKFDCLLDMNKWAFKKTVEMLGLSISISETFEYFDGAHNADYRNSRSESFIELGQSYYQLNHDQGKPFIGNLSILDLLFNQGPNSRLWLKTVLK